MAARFALNSDSSEQDGSEVLTISIGDEAWPRDFTRSRRELPITVAMLEILRDIRQEIGEIGEYVGPISDALRARLLELSAVTAADFHLDHKSQIYLNLPHNIGQAIPAAVIQQLTTAPAPASEWDGFIADFYGGAVAAVPVATDSTRAERRAAVMAAYNLAAPDLTKTYWSNYAARVNPRNDNPNCLINELLYKYSINERSDKKLKAATIIGFFGNVTPTIATAIAFADEFKIPCRIYSMSGGHPIITHTKKFKPKCNCKIKCQQEENGRPCKEETASQRTGFALLAYLNHCYIHTGKTIASSEPQRLPGIRLPTELYNDDAEQDTDAEAERIRKKFLNACRANFNFESEKRITVKALNYDNGKYTVEQQKDRVQIDMVKAFHSATMAAPTADKIGVFTVHDTIKEITADFEIDPSAYYFATLKTVERWEKSTDIVASRKNNMLLGFELEHLIKTGRIAKNEIEAVKKPSYTISVAQYQDTLKTMGDAGKQQFALCNGLLGRSELREAERLHNMTQSDADLIEATHRAKVTPAAPFFNDNAARCDVAILTGRNEYMHLNNRHMYNWTIAQTNREIVKAYDAMSKAARVLLRVRTDSITWLETDAFEFDIRRENLPLKFREVSGGGKPARFGSYQTIEYLDFKKLMADTHTEINDWNAKHKTVIGAPGAGKSYMIKFAKNDDGTDKFDFSKCMAYTNACARQLNTEKGGKEIKGETIHSTLHLFDPASTGETARALAGCSIWLDEISQCAPWLWSVLFVIGKTSTLIMSGDPRQCSPVNSDASGKFTADPLPWASGYLLLAMQKTATIVKDGPKSRNCRELIQFRELIDTEADPLSVLTKMLRIRPELDGKDKNAEILALDSHIVFSNKYREDLNAACVKARGLVWQYSVKGPEIDAKGNVVKSKTQIFLFNASEGLKLVARTTLNAAKIYKGMAYTLRETVTPASTAAVLVCEDGETITIAASDLSKLTLGYARTSYNAQGSTIRGAGAIHQCAGMLLDGEHREIFYTGVTRWTELKNIQFVMGKLEILKAEQPELAQIRGDADESLGANLIVN